MTFAPIDINAVYTPCLHSLLCSSGPHRVTCGSPPSQPLLKSCIPAESQVEVLPQRAAPCECVLREPGETPWAGSLEYKAVSMT